jgi:hypothetical protein
VAVRQLQWAGCTQAAACQVLHTVSQQELQLQLEVTRLPLAKRTMCVTGPSVDQYVCYSRHYDRACLESTKRTTGLLCLTMSAAPAAAAAEQFRHNVQQTQPFMLMS